MELDQQRIKDAFEELRKVRLSSDERAEARDSVVEYMKQHPLEYEFPVGEGDSVVISHSAKGWQALITRSMVRVMIIALTLVAGTVVASEKALPGDPLYAVKTNVIEPVRGALNVTTVARTEWEFELAQRRLEEVISLSDSLKLTQVQYKALIEDFKEHTEASRAIEQRTEVASKSPTDRKVVSITKATEGAHEVGVSSVPNIQQRFKDWLSVQKEQLLEDTADESPEKAELLSVIEEELNALEPSADEDQSFDFSDEQLSTLETLGVDTSTLKELRDQEDSGCFEEALGEKRVAALGGGEEPNLFDVVKIQACINTLSEAKDDKSGVIEVEKEIIEEEDTQETVSQE